MKFGYKLEENGNFEISTVPLNPQCDRVRLKSSLLQWTFIFYKASSLIIRCLLFFEKKNSITNYLRHSYIFNFCQKSSVKM